MWGQCRPPCRQADRAIDWLLFSNFSVFIGLISSYMPFMIYPLWAALDGIDHRLVEASWLLGAGPRLTFLRVTLPLSMPGVFAAVIFGFVGSFGESAVPVILHDESLLRTTDVARRSSGPWIVVLRLPSPAPYLHRRC